MRGYPAIREATFVLLGFVLGTSHPVQAEDQLTVSVQVTPARPHVGPAEIEVHVLDVDGKPVSGASVSILASMPAMKMSRPMPIASMGMLGPKLQVSNAGNGHCRARINLNHSTSWTFVVHTSAKQGYGTGTLTVNVLP
jgi:hypothetical protein